MNWVPIVFVTFKVVVLGTGMFYAIKWHYDQAKKGREMHAVVRTSAKVAAAFVLLALGLVFVTFALTKWLGMDLTMP